MILSQGGVWIGNRLPLFRRVEARQTRFTPTRQSRKLQTVTVSGVPEQSPGLLFKGGASGDVGSFSAPVGMFKGAEFARVDQTVKEYVATRRRHCCRASLQTMKTFCTLAAFEKS